MERFHPSIRFEKWTLGGTKKASIPLAFFRHGRGDYSRPSAHLRICSLEAPFSVLPSFQAIFG